MSPPGASRRDELAANLGAVRARVDAALQVAGRTDDVKIIVVTKFFPAGDVDLLADLGVRQIGENRDQEISAKLAEVRARDLLTVHFIGQLQTNKARSVASYADVVHSVDRPRLVYALDRAAGESGRPLAVLLQVALDDADGRGGCRPDRLLDLADTVASCAHLRLRGLMAVAPLGAPPRPAFARLRELSEEVRGRHPGAIWLSAGMSGDLEDAVAEGATHLRVGTAILGSRESHR